jgi:hypothetical protein
VLYSVSRDWPFAAGMAFPSVIGWGPGQRIAPAIAEALMRSAVAGWRTDVGQTSGCPNDIGELEW